MNEQEHVWQRFYSPRNGRVIIDACALCGVAKGMVYKGHRCSASTSSKRNNNLLKGWTVAAPVAHGSEQLIDGVRLSA